MGRTFPGEHHSASGDLAYPKAMARSRSRPRRPLTTRAPWPRSHRTPPSPGTIRSPGPPGAAVTAGCQPEGLRGLEMDDQLKLCRLLDRELFGLASFENAVNGRSRTP